ncbi:hypothetical protein CANMA_001637 [Candida margitis]|uniref:uncharacterized protein n=1 Tax=Candida margitis TaxID=1775924 RepID=UPI002228037E|nr:uncharacterized protein CANMA_001637 [Candida margitis]KAI5969317.1 hypothetical protein CANMA_001637 [Candida margitis]
MTSIKEDSIDEKINPQLKQETSQAEESSQAQSKPEETQATSSPSSKNNSSATEATTSTNTSKALRKLPPLASLQTVYRSDYQPFTTFLPYEPAYREQQPNSNSPTGVNAVTTTNIAASAVSRLESGDFESASTEAKSEPIEWSGNTTNANDTESRTQDSKVDNSRQSSEGEESLHQQQQQQQQQMYPRLTKAQPSSFLLPKDRQKPFKCTFESCKWTFARQSDLTRHFKSHMAPQYHCPYWKNDPTCHKNGGAFNRLDVLKRHLKLVHFVRDKRLPIGEGNGVSGNGEGGGASGVNATSSLIKSVDEPGWCRSCQRMFPNAKAFIDHCYECASQTQPTEWRSQKGSSGRTGGGSGGGDGDELLSSADLHQTKFRVLLGPPQAKKQKITPTATTTTGT